jgi:hypothetical protein
MVGYRREHTNWSIVIAIMTVRPVARAPVSLRNPSQRWPGFNPKKIWMPYGLYPEFAGRSKLYLPTS